MPSDRVFYRTVIEVEVLSEGPYMFRILRDTAFDIMEGLCSGCCTVRVVESVDGLKMAGLLTSQGSDPGFFNLDSEGNELCQGRGE